MFTESTAFASTNDSTQQHDLGFKHRVYDATYGWRTYAYYKVSDAVNVAVGMCVTFDTTVGNVTADVSGGTGMAAGIALGTITAGNYGWFVCGFGDYALVNTDGGVAAAGEALVPHSVDGEVDTMDAGEEDHAFAVSTSADTTPAHTVVCVIVRGM